MFKAIHAALTGALLTACALTSAVAGVPRPIQPPPVASAPVTGLLVAATKGKIATNSRAGSSGDSSFMREVITLGPGCWTELRLGVMNWWALASATGEGTNAGAMSFEAAFTDPRTLKMVRAQTSGVNVGSVAPNAMTVTDAVPASSFGLPCIPGGTQLLVTERRTLASTSDSHPWWGGNQALTRELEFEGQYSSASFSASQFAAGFLDNYPTLSVYKQSSTSATIGQAMGPATQTIITGANSGFQIAGGLVVLGKNTVPTKSVCLVGNSIADGDKDDQTPMPTLHGNEAFSRGITDTSGNVLASLLKITMPGDRLQWYVGVHGNRNPLLGYCNVGVILYSHNDLAGGRTAAQAAADTVTIAGYMKAAGIPYVAVVPDLPYTSTDTVATTSTTASGTTATSTIPTVQAAALQVGETILRAGAVPAGYNGSWPVTAVNATTGVVSYTVSTSGLAAASTEGTMSDTWQSTVFQTPFSGFESGGTIRDAYNTTIKGYASAKSNNIDAVIDLAPCIETQVPGKFDGGVGGARSGDGIHLIANGAAIAAACVRAGIVAAPAGLGGQ